MYSRIRPTVPGLLLALVLAAPAGAAWSDDPAANFAFADRPGEQSVEKVAVTPYGNVYLAWFDHASGNYDVYLQHLDRDGNELWAHNGILVSAHPQMSWLVDWDLMADSLGNAVVVFSDIRSGGDLDVYAYKVAPDGSQLWGPDGIAISDNADFEPSPAVTETGDGDFVVVWGRSPDAGDGDLRMQRLAPDGTVLLAPGGLPIVAVPGETPGFPDVVPSNDGSVIVSWVRDISTFQSFRHWHACRYSATGSQMWIGPTVVFDAYSLPLGYSPRIKPGPDGGAIFWWHRSDFSLYNSFIQVVRVNGFERFPHNGVAVSTTGGFHHIAPDLAYSPDTDEYFVFWNERNSAQSQWGIYGQKFSSTGVRQWTNGGRQLLPVNSEYKGLPLCVSHADGAMLFYIDQPSGIYGQDRVVGMRVDGDGNQVWANPPLVLASTYSTKGRLEIGVHHESGNTQAVLFWEDERGGSRDIYGQNILDNGTLGPGTVAVGAGALTVSRLLQNYPNPFHGSTRISLTNAPGDNDATVRVFDVAGRLVRELSLGGHSAVFDGRDGQGRQLASGIYYYQLVSDRPGEVMHKAILIR